MSAPTYPRPAPDPHAEVVRLRSEVGRLINALADCVVMATDYGEQDGGFVAFYITPTGPIHRAIPLLQEHEITVRPGFDGRTFPAPAPTEAGEARPHELTPSGNAYPKHAPWCWCKP